MHTSVDILTLADVDIYTHVRMPKYIRVRVFTYMCTFIHMHGS